MTMVSNLWTCRKHPSFSCCARVNSEQPVAYRNHLRAEPGKLRLAGRQPQPRIRFASTRFHPRRNPPEHTSRVRRGGGRTPRGIRQSWRVLAAISSGGLKKFREASTLVLFSIAQMWYLHAIVRRSRRIQNSRCVDPVCFSFFFGFIGSLQHSVQTRSCLHGNRLRVMRNE
jgi:hypothetical protein